LLAESGGEFRVVYSRTGLIFVAHSFSAKILTREREILSLCRYALQVEAQAFQPGEMISPGG